MAVVFGLGNPGPRYAGTRHNVGYRAIERLMDRWRAVPDVTAEAYRSWRAEVVGRPVDLVEPLGFMNASGKALEAWRERRGLDLARLLDPGGLLVVADDVYLPLGWVRLRPGGSSGGHRGLESVEAALGTSEFARLRVGVGAAGSSAELREHVLEEFGAEELEGARAAIETAADAVECWIGEGMFAAMNRFNRRVRKEATES